METHHYRIPGDELREDLSPLVSEHDSTLRRAKETAVEGIEEIEEVRRANLRRAFE